MTGRTKIATAIAAGVALVSSSALAQTEVLDDGDLAKKALAKTASTTPNGWTLKAKVGLTGNINNINSNAESAGVGQGGTTVTVGGVLSAEANFKYDNHGWDTVFNLQEAQSKTPTLEPWIKSLDNLELISTYFYRLNSPEWLGPFARFRFQTQVFQGRRVEEGARTIRLLDTDGTDLGTQDFGAQQPIPLTGSFEPIQIRESAGMFADPIKEDYLKLNAKLGLGGQHQIVRGGNRVEDDDATPELELRELQGSTSAGGELDLAMSGIIVKDFLNWKLTLNFFMPFVTNGTLANGDKAVGLDGLISDIQGAISMKLWKYFSLDYSILIRRVPLVVEGWQVVHGLVLSAGFDIL